MTSLSIAVMYKAWGTDSDYDDYDSGGNSFDRQFETKRRKFEQDWDEHRQRMVNAD